MSGLGRGASLPAWIPAGGAAPGAGAPSAPPPASRAPGGGGGASRAWTSHLAPDGKRTYWHCAATGTSTYEKPEELMTPTEKADAKTRWKEATSADGRAYYHHLDTKETRWAMPDEMRLAREAALAAEGAAAFASTARPPLSSNGPPNGGLANASAPSASAPSASAPSSSRGKSKSPLDSFGPLDSPSARFASLLFDLDVAPETPWAEVSRRIERSTDPRAAALATAGERKRCFNEYKLKRQKIDREAKREAHKRRREAFLASLRAHGDRLGIIPERTKLRDVEKELATDARTKEAFLAVEESRDREELFRRHCEETRERWAEERRERRDAEKRAWLERVKARLGEAFFSFAPAAHDEDEKNDGSNGSPPLWRRARRVDPDPGSDPEAAACERFDRLDAFEREVRAAEAREDADRLREKTAHRKVDREAREAFAATLRELEGKGAISLRVPWRAFVRTRLRERGDARRRFLAARAAAIRSGGSRPKELYEDRQEALEEAAARRRERVEAWDETRGVASRILARERGGDPLEAAEAMRREMEREGFDAAAEEGVFGETEAERRMHTTVACGDALAAERARRAGRGAGEELEEGEAPRSPPRRGSPPRDERDERRGSGREKRARRARDEYEYS